MGKVIDITGQTFGFLTVLYPTRKNGRFAWHCQCECGAEVDVDSNNLRTGKTQSCGCKKKALISQKVSKDLTGKKFGYLTVLAPTEDRQNGSIVWKCQCDCGNICYIPTSNLSSGHTKSCGCSTYTMSGKKLRLKLTGKKFGKLTVIKELPPENLESKWLCQCDCGNKKEVIGWHLTKGIVNSCGCLISKGEAKIQELLLTANIPFKTQATFEDCLSPNGNKLRFDFYIDNKYLIEFDGEQHFLTTPTSLYTQEKLDQIKLYDAIKNQWCIEHNIPLLRIKYTELKNLTIEDLIIKE